MNLIAIDPGRHGGVAVRDKRGIHTLELPKRDRHKHEKTGPTDSGIITDLWKLYSYLESLCGESESLFTDYHCLLEKVGHRGKMDMLQGAAAAIFLEDYGRLKAVLEIRGVTTYLVSPVSWTSWVKKQINIKDETGFEVELEKKWESSRVKDRSEAKKEKWLKSKRKKGIPRLFIEKTFPEVHKTLISKRRKEAHDGIIDAMCMLDYGEAHPQIFSS